MQGVEYAITQLATIPNLSMYIDAAHGGWLGWCGSHPCSSSN
jgi:cellulose 1,4-beta-cellobiosidase